MYEPNWVIMGLSNGDKYYDYNNLNTKQTYHSYGYISYIRPQLYLIMDITSLTHCGLIMPHVGEDLSQHCLR